METFRVQVSVWCKPQARLFAAIVERKFGNAGLIVPKLSESFEDHRTPTKGGVEDLDEIDLLNDDELGASIHFFIDVDSRAKADLIEQASKESTMRHILMPLGSSLIDHPPRILEPFIDIS